MVKRAIIACLILAFGSSSSAATEEVAPLPTAEGLMKLRDPFKAPAASVTKGPDSELEMFPLDEIKLIGVLTGQQKVRAVLRLPNGNSHIVSEKTLVGLRQGVLVKIDSNSVRVVEKVVNILGQEESVGSTITLEEPPKLTGLVPGKSAEAIALPPGMMRSSVSGQASAPSMPTQIALPAAGANSSGPPPAAMTAAPPPPPPPVMAPAAPAGGSVGGNVGPAIHAPIIPPVSKGGG